MKANKQKMYIFILVISQLINCFKDKSPLSPHFGLLPRQLTSANFDYEPFISPNGKNVAFTTSRNTYDPYNAEVLFELWVMDITGKNQQCLISYNDLAISSNGRISVRNVSWHSESKDLVAEINITEQNLWKSEIWKIFLDGTKSRFTSISEYAIFPSYSPDGTRIAYVIQEPYTTPEGQPIYNLYTANREGSEHVLIETGLCEDYTWRSDSQGLIYSLYDYNIKNKDIWYASIDNLTKFQISYTPANESRPSCSTNGEYLAYNVQDSLYVTEFNNFQPQKLLTHAYLPIWTPHHDLLLVVYSENEYDEFGDILFWINESWIIDLKGNIIRKIVEGERTRVSFALESRNFVYSLNGNIWLDYF